MSKVLAVKRDIYSGGYDPLLLQSLAKREAVREAAFFTAYLEPGMRVLDCGCGPGGITLGLTSLVPQGCVVGVDIEAGQLEIGRQHASERALNNVEFRHASIYELPFDDSTFDATLAHAVLYHLGEPMNALRELRRVLKPGGLIGVRDADIDGDVYYPVDPELDQFWKLVDKVLRYNGGNPRFGRKQRQVLREAGFIKIVASASSDSFGTPEKTNEFIQYWTEIFLSEHRQFVLDQKWATKPALIRMRDALRCWSANPDAFYSRCRCEAVAWKPT